MTIAAELLKYQQKHEFEDTVLKFMHQVYTEEVLSKPHAKEYLAEWKLKDGSNVLLNNHIFTEVK